MLLALVVPASAKKSEKPTCVAPSTFIGGIRVEGEMLAKFREKVAPALPKEVDLVLIHPAGTIVIVFSKGCAIGYAQFEPKPNAKDDGAI